MGVILSTNWDDPPGRLYQLLFELFQATVVSYNSAISAVSFWVGELVESFPPAFSVRK